VKSASEPSVSLLIRRRIRASPEQLFAAWTEPPLLRQWWGPTGATCPSAEVELRVGGRYRIENHFADGRVLWISGAFEVIQPPNRLVYTWQVGELTGGDTPTRVTVCFEPKGHETEVVIVHERIADEETSQHHAMGWEACLGGLEALFPS
jgi:uncharacterized protein YndB with AHSA1/START domain